MKVERHRYALRTVAALGLNEQDFDPVRVAHLRSGCVGVKKPYTVGILLDGAGFAQVGESRAPVIPFHVAVQLGEQQDRATQFEGEQLQKATDCGDLPFPVLAFRVGGRCDQLQVVDTNETKAAR